MNGKLARMMLGVAGGLTLLVSDLNHPKQENHSKQENRLPVLDETKPVVKWIMGDMDYPIYSQCEVYDAHELKGAKATFYDCGSEHNYLSIPFTTKGPDGKVDYVAVYRQKGSCTGMDYYTRDDAAKWQQMLAQVKKSRKLEVKSAKFTRVGFC